jgi:carbamate kinase
MLQQILYGEFQKRVLPQHVVTIVTQVVVDKNDSAFSDPTKPIGSYMDETTAKRRKAEGWQVREVEKGRWRRVVPSPKPVRIVEEPVITQLLKDGFVVITAGGGGIPVVEDKDGCLEGVAAVIDKDRVSALLGTTLGARLLLISTRVDKVYINYGKPDQKAIDVMDVSTARRYLKEGHFGAGSMKPKIESAITFLENGGKQAIITSPERLTDALISKAGTRIVPDSS